MSLRSPRNPDAADWAFLAFALVLAGIHLYLGFFEPSVPADSASQFVVIGVVLVVGLVVYLTAYWRPVLYLLGIGLAFYLGILWVLGGMAYFRYGVATGIAATGFVLTGLYLFVRSQTDVETTESPDGVE